MRRAPSSLLFLFVLLMAGCHEPPASPDDGVTPRWGLAGTFTENATQEDIAELDTRLRPYAAELRVMESFPMQYQITGPDAADCPEVKEIVQGLPYIAETGDCDTFTPGADGDQPVSSPTG